MLPELVPPTDIGQDAQEEKVKHQCMLPIFTQRHQLHVEMQPLRRQSTSVLFQVEMERNSMATHHAKDGRTKISPRSAEMGASRRREDREGFTAWVRTNLKEKPADIPVSPRDRAVPVEQVKVEVVS